MINATMCLLQVNKRTLFLYRDRGKWDIHQKVYIPPGGRTERGERGIDCIVREFRQETGLTLIKPKLRVMATFYNQGRILGGKKNPEDWCVEVYEAHNFTGRLREEHPKMKPEWIEDLRLARIKMYPGDRKILELLNQPGVFEVLTQYSGEKLTCFKSRRVA